MKIIIFNFTVITCLIISCFADKQVGLGDNQSWINVFREDFSVLRSTGDVEKFSIEVAQKKRFWETVNLDSNTNYLQDNDISSLKKMYLENHYSYWCAAFYEENYLDASLVSQALLSLINRDDEMLNSAVKIVKDYSSNDKSIFNENTEKDIAFYVFNKLSTGEKINAAELNKLFGSIESKKAIFQSDKNSSEPKSELQSVTKSGVKNKSYQKIFLFAALGASLIALAFWLSKRYSK